MHVGLLFHVIRHIQLGFMQRVLMHRKTFFLEYEILILLLKIYRFEIGKVDKVEK